MNSFVHLSLPDDVMVAIEEIKLACTDCGREYYPEDIKNENQGVYIEKFVAEEGHCYDCGSNNIVRSGNASEFEKQLNDYREKKDAILGFYDHLGLLVDFEIKGGYEDYAQLSE